MCFHHAHDFERDNSVKYGSLEYWSREEDAMEEQEIREVAEEDGNPWALLEETYLEGL
jgi:hypothetical protein